LSINASAEFDSNCAYGLERKYNKDRYFLPVAYDDAVELKTSVDDLTEIMEVEQKFDIMMANFAELETEMVCRLVISTYRSDHSSREYYEDQLAFNRRIINVFTSTRLYVEQSTHHAGVIFGKQSSMYEDFVALFSKEYDASFSYRLMEALRNYSQHRGLPLKGLVKSSKVVKADYAPRDLSESNIAFMLMPNDLSGLKASVLSEFRSNHRYVDLKFVMREYVEALARVHSKFRDMVNVKFSSANTTIHGWIDRFSDECSREFSSLGCDLIQDEGDGKFTKLAHLDLDMFELVAAIKSRTRSLEWLSRRTISTAKMVP
jgi:hypothetical protein